MTAVLSRAYSRALSELTRTHREEFDQAAADDRVGYAGARSMLRDLYREEFDAAYAEALLVCEDEDDVEELRAAWVPVVEVAIAGTTCCPQGSR